MTKCNEYAPFPKCTLVRRNGANMGGALRVATFNETATLGQTLQDAQAKQVVERKMLVQNYMADCAHQAQGKIEAAIIEALKPAPILAKSQRALLSIIKGNNTTKFAALDSLLVKGVVKKCKNCYVAFIHMPRESGEDYAAYMNRTYAFREKFGDDAIQQSEYQDR